MDEAELVISQKDLSSLKDLRIKNAMVAHEAEKAHMKAKISELEYKVAIQEVYLKYGIAITDSVDESTGKVTRIVIDKKENINE